MTLGELGHVLVILAGFGGFLILAGLIFDRLERRRWSGTKSYDEAEAEKRMRDFPHGSVGRFKA